MNRIAVSLLSFGLFAAAASAAPPAADPPQRTITLTGTGIATAPPELVRFSTGVTTQGATAGAALSANSKAMAAVIASLKARGVPAKSLQTADVSLSPQYQSCKPNVVCPQKIVGYEVANTLTVTIEIAKAGEAMDALVASGANRIDGIGFLIADMKPLLAAAREAAVKEAIAKAEAYTRAAGVRLGPVQSISEGGFSQPMAMNMAMAYRDKAMAVPLEAGEEKISATVSITWAIE